MNVLDVPKIKEKLIELVDDVNIKNKFDSSPLSLSVSHGIYDLFIKLIEKGADVKANKNILFQSVRHGSEINKRIIVFLLDKGFSPFEKIDGKTPYNYVQEEILEYERDIEKIKNNHNIDKEYKNRSILISKKRMNTYIEILEIFEKYRK